MNKREVRSTPHTNQKRTQSQGVINDLDNVDFIPSNVQSSHQEALLYRVALDWLFDRINFNPKIQIKYIDTKNQLADMLTKGNITQMF